MGEKPTRSAQHEALHEAMAQMNEIGKSMKLLDEKYGALILDHLIAKPEKCPTIGIMAWDVKVALLQLSDTLGNLKTLFENNTNCTDFVVEFTEDLNTSTELVAVTGNRCAGFELDWSDLEGKTFSQCLGEVSEWATMCYDSM
ncbi:MAG: hypothetical protein ABIF77_16070 [bacterium]